MNKVNNLSSNTKVRITIYSEAGIGITGNSFLLFHILRLVRGQKPRLTDLPIGLLALIHILMLLVMSLLATDIFMTWGIWEDTICKFIITLYWNFRNLSLCASSLLSVLQAITLSSRSSCIAKFKRKSAYYMLGCLVFLSVFNVSLNIPFLSSITVISNWTSSSLIYVTESCFVLPLNDSVQHMFHLLLMFSDFIFVGLMALSSVYMVTFLCKHKKQSQFLHNSSLFHKSCAVQRATQTILCLMSFFVVMYTLDSSIAYLTRINDDSLMHFISFLINPGYATVSPFLVLINEKQIFNIFVPKYGKSINV